MRFLKKKIAMAQAFHAQQKKLFRNSTCSKMTKEHPHPTNAQKNKRKRIPGFSATPEKSRQTKNIVKNFGKAICSFAISPVALPYLQSILQREEVEINDFISYVNNIKGIIDGLHHFRAVLLLDKNDTKQVAACKKIFKDISEVFIKYFSVNWIFHSKVLHKEAHLKFRFKMLRRIKSPELFTYLKSHKNPKNNHKV